MDELPISPEWSNTSGVIRNNERSVSGNSAKLTPANPIGPWRTIKVNKGDQITVKAQGKYVEAATNNTTAVNLTTYVNGLPAQTSESKNSPRMLSLGLTISPQGVNTNSGSIPKAYLEYILQNSDEKGVARRRTYVTTKASTTYGPDWEVLEMTYLVEEDGYVQVLVINESDKPVWFDNVSLEVKPGLTFQETHYDPWGLELAGIEDRGNPEDEYKFQGKEVIDELALNWQDFGARYYDPQLGRWHVTDPADQFGSPYVGMGNNPVNGTDPDGCWFGFDDLAAAGIGFAIGYVSSGISSGDWGGKSLKAGGIGAVTGWLAYNTAGLSMSATSASGSVWMSSNLGTFAANTALSTASSYLPSAQMQFGNLSISLNPSFAYGSDGMSAGFNVNASAQIGPLSIGGSVGGSYSGKFIGTGGKGWESRASFGGGVNTPDFGLNFYSTAYKGSNNANQRVGGVRISSGDFSIQYENDDLYPLSNSILTDRGDRFRTTALKASWKDISGGFNLFTGDPGVKNRDPYGADPATKFLGTYKEKTEKYRLGAVYAGYKSYQVGRNSEKVRNFLQNNLAHGRGYKFPLFEVIPSQIPWRNYFRYGSQSNYSLW